MDTSMKTVGGAEENAADGTVIDPLRVVLVGPKGAARAGLLSAADDLLPHSRIETYASPADIPAPATVDVLLLLADSPDGRDMIGETRRITVWRNGGPQTICMGDARLIAKACGIPHLAGYLVGPSVRRDDFAEALDRALLRLGGGGGSSSPSGPRGT